MASTKVKSKKGVVPMIYAYTTPEIARHDGWTKIGYTEQDVDKRLDQQSHTVDVIYKEEWRGKAEFDDGSGETFTDHDFHRHLTSKNIERLEGTEFFKISPDDSKNEFYSFRSRSDVLKLEQEIGISYKLRDEQKRAVQNALDYKNTHDEGEFLWNAKPRFGKTLATYELAKRMEAQRILVLTNRPAIINSWYEDYIKFVTDYFDTFVTRNDALKGKKHVVSKFVKGLGSVIEFESFQDLKGSIYFGGKYDKFKELYETEWDLLVLDEAHEGVDTYKSDVAFDHIKRKFTLHLSGTPFKALANDKFEDKAIFNWTYADEQRKKQNWSKEHTDSTEQNPYQNLPQLNMFTYQMSEMIKGVVNEGINIDGEIEEYAFDLNEFFKTTENGEKRFIHEPAVNKFLDALTKQEKYPFSTPELRDELKHTVWLLDRVDSAKTLKRKLKEHEIFKDYEIVLAAGDGSLDDEKAYDDAYNRVVNAIANNDKTITLTVGQLTTGITIPEWTAVLMLSNVASPSLYMQAAFRAQNPCLFHEGSKCFRKENAYVFDFDPARTLTIYEKFANDLSADTSDGRGSVETREDHIKELLNFFPVIGEDSEGKMIELDASAVLSIPRKIRSVEVVKRGFMSNFLFQNISNIFSAPSAVKDILEKLTPVEEPKNKEVAIDNDTAKDLNLDENGDVSLSNDFINNVANELFGEKIYGVSDSLGEVIENLQFEDVSQSEEDKTIEELKDKFAKNITEPLINEAKTNYGKDLSSGEQKRIERIIQSDVERSVGKAVGDYQIQRNIIEIERNNALNRATTDEEVRRINIESNNKRVEAQNNFKEQLKEVADKSIKDAGKTIVGKVETHKRNVEKQSIEEGVRDRLRGFSRTIPSFLMAYGTRETTLDGFDKIIPENVFEDVTSITIKQFKFLRDGGYYLDNGDNTFTYLTEEEKNKYSNVQYYEGHLFDEVVFNDSVQEFLNKKQELANYFDETHKEDIFDYIPPQKNNQIFTPKKVVKEMVDMLEEENPGCFDDDSKTFADLYMKSGLYIAEIVKRLYNSEVMKQKYPNEKDRLNHIFEKQVYGLAPTEIIYRICLSFILGFSDDIKIEKHNIKLLDALPYAKNETLEQKLIEVFDFED